MLSSRWRLEALPPARVWLTTANEMLDGYVFTSFIEAAAEEALGTDPRYLDLNLRRLLQTSQSAAFLPVAGLADPEQI